MAKSPKPKDAVALCTISGPLDNFGFAVHEFIIDRSFSPENAVSFTQEMILLPMDTDNPHEETLNIANRLLSALDIHPTFKSFRPGEMNIAATEEYLTNLLSRVDSYRSRALQLTTTIEDNKCIIGILSRIKQVGISIDPLLTMKSVQFRFGRIPTSIYLNARQRINHRDDLYFMQTSVEDDFIYGMYFAIPSSVEKADAFFAALKFERIWISNKVHGPPAQAIEEITAENRELSKELSRLGEERILIRREESDRLLHHYSYLRLIGDTYGYRGYAGQKDGQFYLVGWIPLSSAAAYADEVNSSEGLSCIIRRPEDLQTDSNDADDRKFIRLLETEQKARTLYDYAIEVESRLPEDISTASENIRASEYARADKYLSEERAKARAQSDGQISKLNEQLQTSLDSLKQSYEAHHKEWSDIIFNAAINLD